MNQDAGITGLERISRASMIFICIVRHLKTGFVKLLRSEELAARFPESAPFSDSIKGSALCRGSYHRPVRVFGLGRLSALTSRC